VGVWKQGRKHVRETFSVVGRLERVPHSAISRNSLDQYLHGWSYVPTGILLHGEPTVLKAHSATYVTGAVRAS